MSRCGTAVSLASRRCERKCKSFVGAACPADEPPLGDPVSRVTAGQVHFLSRKDSETTVAEEVPFNFVVSMLVQ